MNSVIHFVCEHANWFALPAGLILAGAAVTLVYGIIRILDSLFPNAEPEEIILGLIAVPFVVFLGVFLFGAGQKLILTLCEHQ